MAGKGLRSAFEFSVLFNELAPRTWYHRFVCKTLTLVCLLEHQDYGAQEQCWKKLAKSRYVLIPNHLRRWNLAVGYDVRHTIPEPGEVYRVYYTSRSNERREQEVYHLNDAKEESPSSGDLAFGAPRLQETQF